MSPASLIPPVTHGYLPGEPPLFASHHAPAASAPARNIAYVVCLPVHLDLIQSYRSMRVLAEVLAAAGFHVLRVHYDGTGESIGATDDDPGRVAAWLESVRRAVESLAALPGIEGVGLVGIRLGGTLALETATRMDIARLVLWEAPNGAAYTREMEILDASTPRRLLQGEALADPAAGLVAGGYRLSRETITDLGFLALDKMQLRGRPDVLLVQRADRKPSPKVQKHLEAAGCAVTAVQLPGHPEMMAMPERSAVPAAIIGAVCEWAVARSSPASGAAARGPALAPELTHAGLRWRILRFGSGDHLFGILTEPASGPRRGLPAVLLLTGGVTPRTAGNGSYVALTKRLAAKGHAVLRMDLAFIGESGTPDGTPGKGNDPFPASILDDARAGLDRACACAGVASGANAWVLGLCSGAYAAFQVARVEPRVLGVFIINPTTFHREAPAADTQASADAGTLSTVDQLEQMQRYLQVMRDPQSWKKLLSGKANVRHIVKVVGARVGSKLEAAKEAAAVRLGRAPKGVARDLEELLARGAKVNLVFSEGDPGQAMFAVELGAREAELVKKGLHVQRFAGADHNFHELSSRAELLDWLTATIAG